ncbi:hypothetical protein AX774_g7941 [Zancudomyces culisetae]|uniref:Uncharacterized protein n=1 Tax=Zancudomyces culisetae TaxID=1213189 RepID=A0A1R1PCF9_ZANCU|nr:hypothetical protein AX774_g7941 [Zancudomyces culisetae]|eukprot:OMH78665.1 hypothetical protein AX774_g7941 [Zancudomyces culisetae]
MQVLGQYDISPDLQAKFPNRDIANDNIQDLYVDTYGDMSRIQLTIGMQLDSSWDGKVLYAGFSSDQTLVPDIYELKFSSTEASGVAKGAAGALLASGQPLPSLKAQTLGIVIDNYGRITMGTGSSVTNPVAVTVAKYTDNSPLPKFRYLHLYSESGKVTFSNITITRKLIAPDGTPIEPVTVVVTNTKSELATVTVTSIKTQTATSVFTVLIPTTLKSTVDTTTSTTTETSFTFGTAVPTTTSTTTTKTSTLVMTSTLPTSTVSSINRTTVSTATTTTVHKVVFTTIHSTVTIRRR